MPWRRLKSKAIAMDNRFPYWHYWIMATITLTLIIFLFTMQYHYLESGRKQCEAEGGEWHSTVAGKITITKCE